METKEIRKKLMNDFGKILEDDTKFLILEGVFDAINSENPVSKVPESHYLKVEESKTEYLLDKSTAISWEDFEKEMNFKYGF